MLKIPKIDVADAERERESTIQQGVAVGMDDWNKKRKMLFNFMISTGCVYSSFLFLYLLSTKEASEVSSLSKN